MIDANNKSLQGGLSEGTPVVETVCADQASLDEDSASKSSLHSTMVGEDGALTFRDLVDLTDDGFC